MTHAEAVSPVPTAGDRTAAAVWFAGHGFGIFPVWSTRDGRCRCPAGPACASPGKHPITVDGFKSATTDPDRIRTFLAARSEPNYGMVPPDGVFIWDVDTDDERARLAVLEARHGPLPPTLRDDTGNGQHLFLRWPDGLPRPLHKMFGFVTRWGSGSMQGYVVGPLSVHVSGRVYRSAKGSAADIATLPEAWARAAVEGDTITFQHGGTEPEAVAVGGRHDWLRNRARFYAGTLRDESVLFAAVWAENLRLPVPKTEDEVRRAIGDALVKFPADPVEVDAETGETRRAFTDEIGMLPPAASGAFPPEPGAAAFHGLLGECVMDVADDTDASLVGLLGSLLAFAGALIPGQAYQHRMQTTSPFVALVGESSTGRKGTAMWRAHDAMCDALESVYVNRVVLDGINSGEGLITTLAYKQATYPQEPTVGLVFEEEYASLLASRSRDGSTLDPKMRAAWDGGPLSNRRSNDTKTVQPPYWLPALIAITPVELRQRIGADAMQSGSANRWLYLPVQRREVVALSSPPRFAQEHREALQAARRASMDAVRPVTAVASDVAATLTEYQDHIARVSHGTSRDMTRRLPMIAFRVALIHAVSERARQVTGEHLERAMALTEYARAGVDWVFGGTVGNRDADLLLRSLRKVGGLSQHAITQRIIRDPIRRQDAMDELVRLGYAVVNTVHQTGGRPREELAIAPGAGGFRAFRATFSNSEATEQQNSARIARNSVDDLHESCTEPARNLHESTSVDRETGEIADRSQSSVRCSAYREHHARHVRTPSGWVCRTCEGQGA